MCEEAPKIVVEFESMGAPFSRFESGLIALKRRLRINFAGIECWVTSKEDYILSKLVLGVGKIILMLWGVG